MKTIAAILCFILTTAAIAQPQVTLKSNEERGNIEIVGFDNFGYEYYIQHNIFYKHKGSTLLQYQNLSLGKLKHVDLQNPLSMVLFYEDFNTVVLLDNQLNQISTYNFSEYISEPLVITAVGMASQNRLWVYNSVTQMLGLFSYLNNNYKAITQQMAGNLRYYESDFNNFQWVDDKGKRYSCTIFGNISSLGNVPAYDHLQFVSNTQLLYLKQGTLYIYDAATDKSEAIDLGKISPTGFWYSPQNLTIFTSNGISNYKITLP